MDLGVCVCKERWVKTSHTLDGVREEDSQGEKWIRDEIFVGVMSTIDVQVGVQV